MAVQIKDIKKLILLKKENNITFSGHIGSNYVFAEEIKPNVLIKNEELRPALSGFDKSNLDICKSRRNNEGLKADQPVSDINHRC